MLSEINEQFVFCRYNCAGLRFGKVDIGRYGEVSQRSLFCCKATECFLFSLEMSFWQTIIFSLNKSFSTGTVSARLLCRSSCPHCCCSKGGGRFCDVQWWTRKAEQSLGLLMRFVFVFQQSTQQRLLVCDSLTNDAKQC